MLINITGSHDLTLFELDEAANRIREEVDPDANIIVGSTLDTDMEGTMRVSVVATGIDASEIQNDIPLPRRSMAAPLKTKLSVEEVRHSDPLPLEQPIVAATDAAAAVEDEPGLFDVERTAAADLAEDLFDGPQPVVSEDDDGLPPPAYQPEIPAFEPRAETLEASPEQLVAPTKPAAGTVSDETMARLRKAVEKSAPEAAAPATGEHQPEQSRFGRLITRMTGHATDTPGESVAPAAPRTQPTMYNADAGSAAQKLEEGEQDRIEIPAFLRRQAN